MAIAKAYVRHVDGHSLIGRAASHHWVPIDSPAEGTPSAASDPIQLQLIACAGCVMLDVVSVLTKARQEFHLLEIDLEAVRRDIPPKIIRQLDYHLRINGAIVSEKTVHRAVELSLTNYCSVSLSLDRSVKFFAQITLNDSVGDRWEIARDAALYEETTA